MVSNVIVLYPKEKFIIPINFKYSNYLNKTLQNTKFQNQHKLNINCVFYYSSKKSSVKPIRYNFTLALVTAVYNQRKYSLSIPFGK